MHGSCTCTCRPSWMAPLGATMNFGCLRALPLEGAVEEGRPRRGHRRGGGSSSATIAILSAPSGGGRPGACTGPGIPGYHAGDSPGGLCRLPRAPGFVDDPDRRAVWSAVVGSSPRWTSRWCSSRQVVEEPPPGTVHPQTVDRQMVIALRERDRLPPSPDRLPRRRYRIRSPRGCGRRRCPTRRRAAREVVASCTPEPGPRRGRRGRNRRRLGVCLDRLRHRLDVLSLYALSLWARWPREETK